MGVWGTAIAANDTYADVYGEFFDLYNDGLAVNEISEMLIAEYHDTINHDTDAYNFWFALAKAQWECKQLNSDVLKRVSSIIDSSADLEVWKQLGASEKDIIKRNVTLQKFLTEIQSERTKAKVRRKKTMRQPAFEKGACITFKLDNGNYGGAVVLEAVYNTEYGHNLIAVTRINQPQKPVLKDFNKAEVLIKNFANWKDKINIQWILPIRYKQVAHLFEVICTINVDIVYQLEGTSFGFCGDFDIYIIQQVNNQFQSEALIPKPLIKKTVKEYVKKRRWFW